MQLCAKDLNRAFLYVQEKNGSVEDKPCQFPTTADGPLVSIEKLNFY